MEDPDNAFPQSRDPAHGGEQPSPRPEARSHESFRRTLANYDPPRYIVDLIQQADREGLRHPDQIPAEPSLRLTPRMAELLHIKVDRLEKAVAELKQLTRAQHKEMMAALEAIRKQKSG